MMFPNNPKQEEARVGQQLKWGATPLDALPGVEEQPTPPFPCWKAIYAPHLSNATGQGDHMWACEDACGLWT